MNLRREVEKMRGLYPERCPTCGQEKPDEDHEPTERPDLSSYTDDELDELHGLADEYEALCERVDALRRQVEDRLATANGSAA